MQALVSPVQNSAKQLRLLRSNVRSLTWEHQREPKPRVPKPRVPKLREQQMQMQMKSGKQERMPTTGT